MLINLYGGNDGLNCVVPHGDDALLPAAPGAGDRRRATCSQSTTERGSQSRRCSRSRRCTIKAWSRSSKASATRTRSLALPLHGNLADRGAGEVRAHRLARALLRRGRPADDNLFKGVAVSQVLPEVLVSDRTDIPAIPGLGEYVDGRPTATPRRATPSRARRAISSLPFASPYLAHVMEIEGDAQRSSEELPQARRRLYDAKASYPATELGRSLALAAQIVGSNLGTQGDLRRARFVRHARQPKGDAEPAARAVLRRGRRVLRRSRRARQRRARAHADLQRVRTAHRRERQPRHRPRRGLAALSHRRRRQGRPVRRACRTSRRRTWATCAYTTDFRSVYATVLERWLGRPSATVLAGSSRPHRAVVAAQARSELCKASSILVSWERRRALRRRAPAARVGRHVDALRADADPRGSRSGRAGARALARSALQSARARRNRALAQASRPFGRRQRA